EQDAQVEGRVADRLVRQEPRGPLRAALHGFPVRPRLVLEPQSRAVVFGAGAYEGGDRVHRCSLRHPLPPPPPPPPPPEKPPPPKPLELDDDGMLAYIVPVAVVPKSSTALARINALNGWLPRYQPGLACSAPMPSNVFAHFFVQPNTIA